MKKLLLAVLAVVCAITGELRAQNNNPGGPANIAGNLYASNFAAWNVPQGNNGPLSWSYGSACSSATSGGTTFKPLVVGTPIRIVDSKPSLSETVTVSSVMVAGSGCLINVTPSNPHQNFYLTSATGGLQEAINFANGQPYVVILTPDWTRVGGIDAMIAQAKGNNAVTLLDSRTSVSTPYLWNGSTYVATPYGGGALLPNPGIVVGLTSSSGRIATLADFVGTSGTIWSGSGCATGTNALLANGQCGPSGGGSPAGPQLALQFNNSSAFAGSSGATADASGNTQLFSLNGLPDAFKHQTTPTSNNGLFNALQTPGNQALAGPDYALTEAVTGGAFWRVPLDFFNTSFLFSVSPGYAVNTFFQDQRHTTTASNMGFYSYNAPGTTSGVPLPIIYNRVHHDQETQAAGTGQTWVSNWDDFSWVGSGKNETGIWDVRIGKEMVDITTRRGIDAMVLFQCQKNGIGDLQCVDNNVLYPGGNFEGAAEGGTNYRNQSIENQQVWTGAASGTLATGTTLIPAAYLASSGLAGDGMPLVDTTQSSLSTECLITAVVPPSSDTIAGSYTTTCSYTPDNIGREVTDESTIPQMYNGGTTQVTIAVTGLTSALVVSPAGVGDTLFADGINGTELVHLTSVGTFSGGNQTIVANLRYPHFANTYISQGAQAGKYLELVANEKGNGGGGAPLRNWVRLIGASAAHTLLYAAVGAGHFQIFAGGAFTPFVFAPTTLTRSSGHTSLTITNFFTQNLNNAHIRINCAADSSYNGVFQMTQTGFGTDTFTWTNAGADGTTTTSCNSSIMTNFENISGGAPSNGYIIFPGAEVVYTGNPSTNIMDGSNLVEANNMTIASGDTLEVQHGNEVISTINHNLVTTWTPTSPSIASQTTSEELSGLPRDGYQWNNILIGLDGGETNFFGGGGTRSPSMQYMAIGGDRVWDKYFITPAPATAIWTINTCPLLTGPMCTNQTLPYALFSVQNVHSSFQNTWSEYNSTWGLNNANQNFVDMSTTSFNFHGTVAGGGDYGFNMGDGALSSFFGDSAGDTTAIDATATTFETEVHIPAGSTSHFIQTGAGFTFDQSVTLTGTGVPIESGTASNTDLNGELTFAATTTETYTFVSSPAPSIHMECVAYPQFDPGTGVRTWITYTGVTSMTINFSSAVTGAVTYQCIGRD